MHLEDYTWRPVSGLKNDPLLDVVNGAVLHVDAGNATSLYNWFNEGSGGVESTAFLPKSAAHHKEQYRDTLREADAQAAGNSWIGKDRLRHGLLSLETQGFGSGEWNSYQIDGIKDFLLQTSREHKFPLQVIGEPHGHGVGYHSMFDEWNPHGHSCPGPDRIIQFHDIIVPWMKQVSEAGKYYVTKKGDTAPSVAKHFKITVWELWRWNPGVTLPFKVGTKLQIRP